MSDDIIDLYGKQLHYYPDMIIYHTNLDAIKNMNLSFNKFDDIPSFFFNMYNLEILNLAYNEIIHISKKISKLINLKILSLSNNYIKIIPDSIGNLINLQYLNISHNKMYTIPDTIGNIINLKTLKLSNNNIEIIPDSISNLINLKILDLSNNQIKNIPDSIGNLVNLKILDLSNNQIKIIPNNIYNLTNLIDLQYNVIISMSEYINKFNNSEISNIKSKVSYFIPNNYSFNNPLYINLSLYSLQFIKNTFVNTKYKLFFKSYHNIILNNKNLSYCLKLLINIHKCYDDKNILCKCPRLKIPYKCKIIYLSHAILSYINKYP
jgi:Leucine-rich repeat (LRR) protein